MPARVVATPFRRAFTLIELLATLAIVSVLAAFLFSAIRGFVIQSQRAKCASNLRQIFLAAESYSQENDGRLVPGSSLGASPFWINALAPYLDIKANIISAPENRFRCPSLKPGQPNYWAWGYGMNARPGYEGASTSAFDQRYDWGPLSTGWTRPFQSAGITHKSRRLFLCDAREWQVQPAGSAAGIATFPDYNRHGKNACNVLFYDGHVEPLDSAQINRALFNPGNQ